MKFSHKSSAYVQMKAEDVMFDKIEELLNIKLEKNKRIYLADNVFTYMQPDFYSEDKRIVGEIFAHIGKYKKGQSNKIANDILKMLLLEKVTGTQYKKIIAVCDLSEKEKLAKGKSILAESIRQFDIDILHIELDENLKRQIIKAQETQKMVNSYD